MMLRSCRGLVVFAISASLVACSGQLGGDEAEADAALGTSFAPTADAETQAAAPSKNFGSATTFSADGWPARTSYLRFHVAGLTGKVTHAIFSCFVTNGSNNGPAIHLTSGNWSESAVTWDNKPALGAVVANASSVGRNSWWYVDVTSAVDGNGDVNLALAPDSNDAVTCVSREGSSAQRPRLSVVTQGTTTPNDGGTQPPPANDAGTPPPPPTDAGTPTLPSKFGVGAYMGSFSTSTFHATFGTYPQVESIYYEAPSASAPKLAQHEAQIDLGVSPILDLEFKGGPFTQAQIAAWGSDVQAFFKTWMEGMNTLVAYAKAKNNGTVVYFSYEHEAVVKIDQSKYTFSGYNGGQPTIAESVAAYNKVMAYAQSAAPGAVRLYWYGGSGSGEDTYANAISPKSLVQVVTFDPYRWSHNKTTDTAQSLWGDKITHLKQLAVAQNADGSLKPWGLTEWGTEKSFGDASNATFIRETTTYIKAQGAIFANYFDRDAGENFLFTDGTEPLSVAAFKAGVP